MNDLDLMTEFRSELAPAAPDAMAGARTRLLAEAAAPPARLIRPTTRWGWRVAPAAGLALAVAAALVIVNHRDVAAPLDARTVFQLAAAHARQMPAHTPRPDQFVYIESVVSYGDPPVTKHRQLWSSVDGSRDGWLDVTSDDPGRQAGPPDLHNPVRWFCTGGTECGTPAYLPNLPTDKDQMRAYLAANGTGEQNPLEYVGELIRDHYLPSPVLAALFEAAATIPGVVVVPDAVDAAGRRGVAVAKTTCGIGSELIFNATTHEYLGDQDFRGPVTDTTAPCPPALTDPVLGATAQTKVAIVDRARQLP
jgi:hypothetical protein